MRSLLVSIAALLVPSIAIAQPGADSGPPAPPPAPGEPPPAPPPGEPPPGPPPPAMMVPVQPAFGPPRSGFDYHRGVTFEANLGIGFVHATGGGQSDNSDSALAGLDLGVGGWLSRQLALTFRISGVDVRNSGDTSNATTVTAFAGPSLQYWPDRHFWVGAGAGLAVLALVSGACDSTNDNCSVRGFGLDARVGYTLGDGAHTFNVSAELTPGFYSEGGQTATLTGFALLLGYQYL